MLNTDVELTDLEASMGSPSEGPIVFQPDRFIAEGEYVVMQARGRAPRRSAPRVS
jgi:hypothetical protein